LARYHDDLAKGRNPDTAQVVGYLDAAGAARHAWLYLRLDQIAREQAEELRALAAKRGFVIPDDD
jgi:hypothetical protein